MKYINKLSKQETIKLFHDHVSSAKARIFVNYEFILPGRIKR